MLKLDEFIRILDSWGLSDVLLPFLLVFTIIFAVLQKAKIFGEGKKNINTAISVIMGMLFVIPHVLRIYPEQSDPVEIMKKSIPQVSIVIIAIVMLLILIGLFGGEVHLLGVALSGWITFISIGIVLLIFGGAAGWWNLYWLERLLSSDAISLVIVLLVFGLLIVFISGGEKKEKKEPSMFEKLDKVFTGNK